MAGPAPGADGRGRRGGLSRAGASGAVRGASRLGQGARADGRRGGPRDDKHQRASALRRVARALEAELGLRAPDHIRRRLLAAILRQDVPTSESPRRHRPGAVRLRQARRRLRPGDRRQGERRLGRRGRPRRRSPSPPRPRKLPPQRDQRHRPQVDGVPPRQGLRRRQSDPARDDWRRAPPPPEAPVRQARRPRLLPPRHHQNSRTIHRRPRDCRRFPHPTRRPSQPRPPRPSRSRSPPLPRHASPPSPARRLLTQAHARRPRQISPPRQDDLGLVQPRPAEPTHTHLPTCTASKTELRFSRCFRPSVHDVFVLDR
mmetsp:Transcript_17557/g.54873  ORF Transcript_17557/g.54873 Transcript_17557/m.54873 type:complete len:316 (-) Transcript_17557:58-1005(-)